MLVQFWTIRVQVAFRQLIQTAVLFFVLQQLQMCALLDISATLVQLQQQHFVVQEVCEFLPGKSLLRF